MLLLPLPFVKVIRIIDNVVITALKVGAQMQKSRIDSELILVAVNEQAP